MAAAFGTAGDSVTRGAAAGGPSGAPGKRAAPPFDQAHALIKRILSRQRDFDFYQLLHLLETHFGDVAPIGRQGPVGDERLRLRPTLSLGFPSADIDEIEWIDGQAVLPDRLRITTTFLGLYGTNSPLPTHFTERLVLSKDDPDEYEKDERERAFLDLIHHRIYSMLYRVWVKYRYYVTFREGGDDGISQVVRGLLGIGTACGAGTLGDRLRQMHPVRLFRYAGLMSQRPRNAAGLEGMLRDWLGGIPVQVTACVGRWLRIEMSDQNRMGLGKCTLGNDLLTGERVFDRSGKFRVRLGPLDYATYESFLPDTENARKLAEMVHFYTDDPLDFDVELVLRGDQVPDNTMGGATPGRLGWTSWNKSQPSADKSVIFRAAVSAF